MIKTAGRFQIQVGEGGFSWLSVDGKLENITLSEEDLYDLKHLIARAIKIFKDKQKGK